MKTPNKDLVLLVWNDAQFDQSGNWKGPAVTHSVGWRLKDVKRCVRLAQSFSANQGYAEILTVPVGMVVSVALLGEVEEEFDPDIIDEGPGRIGG